MDHFIVHLHRLQCTWEHSIVLDVCEHKEPSVPNLLDRSLIMSIPFDGLIVLFSALGNVWFLKSHVYVAATRLVYFSLICHDWNNDVTYFYLWWAFPLTKTTREMVTDSSPPSWSSVGNTKIFLSHDSSSFWRLAWILKRGKTAVASCGQS